MPIWHLEHSSRVSWNMKSSGKRSMLRLTCLFSWLTSTPYNSAKSLSSITWTPRIVKIRERIKSEFDNSCMVSSFMSYKILVLKCLNYIIFASIIIGGWNFCCVGLVRYLFERGKHNGIENHEKCKGNIGLNKRAKTVIGKNQLKITNREEEAIIFVRDAIS